MVGTEERRLSASPGGHCEDPAQRLIAWIEPHWALMYRVAVALCGPADAEDVVQDALAAAWRKRSQYNGARGMMRSWVLAIVVDQARKSRSKRWRSTSVGVEDFDDVAAVGVDVERTMDVIRAVHALGQRQREAVVLFYFFDLPVSEVADAMGCSVGTVKSTLSDARRRLKELLKDG